MSDKCRSRPFAANGGESFEGLRAANIQPGKQLSQMPTHRSPRNLSVVRAAIGWLVLVVLSSWLLTAFGPRVSQPYRPGMVRFLACGSLVWVAVAQLTIAFVSGFIIVLLIQTLFQRQPMSTRRFAVAAVVVGTTLFILSFGGAVLLRRSSLAFAPNQRLPRAAPAARSLAGSARPKRPAGGTCSSGWIRTTQAEPSRPVFRARLQTVATQHRRAAIAWVRDSMLFKVVVSFFLF
jgi:hypothetical protein